MWWQRIVQLGQDNSLYLNDMNELVITKDVAVDIFELELSKCHTFTAPLVHLFTPGMYTRQILMTAKQEVSGAIVDNWHVSKVHKTTHAFCVLAGKCAVYNMADEFLGLIEAPYTGITIKGSRRILQIIEDCIWTTSHPLPYITGEENAWSPELKEMLLMRIENDLVETRDINEGDLQWHLQQFRLG